MSEAPPARVVKIDQVACERDDPCVAIGETQYGAVLLSTTDLGVTWRDQDLPGLADSDLSSVACAESGCVAIEFVPGMTAVAWRLSPSAETWQATELPSGTTQWASVARGAGAWFRWCRYLQ